MTYLEYITGLLPTMTVTDEVNYEYSGAGTVVIIKYLQGQNYLGSQVVPVQLTIHTDDIPTTRTLLATFAQTYNTHAETLDWNGDVHMYVKMYYTTPMLITPMQDTGSVFTAQIIVSGTLIISDNLSDIKTVKIDGYEIETTSRNLNYFTVPNSQKKSTLYHSTSVIEKSGVRLTLTGLNKNTAFCTQLRRIRLGTLKPNTTFSVVLTFTDNDETETYTMVMLDHSVNSSNTGLPGLTVTLQL